MRLLKRDRRKIYYAHYTGKTEVTETVGTGNSAVTLHTGEYQLSYGELKSAYVYLSVPIATALAAEGNSVISAYGARTEYRRSVVSEKDLELGDADVLWIDKEPYETVNNVQVLTEPDYRVRRVAKSFHHFRYEVKEY